ncbi:DUF3445 domain-containing protein [Microbulbifer sp. SH-1]|uniref:heme-dependent oxidative N-demethylase family protein n=1 Tax=Microbulbifer sp. SH-1 TaxID=2681547 RepID=UPI0014084FC9|nr:DUF3445 domain-containing protein [Microbulbifer sp. SH-1]QIL89447.1 DUF3445 domain-containing protein [Microbulbifer sp. SH-1]
MTFNGNSSETFGQAASILRRFAQDLISPDGCLPFVREPDVVHMGLNRLSSTQWIPRCEQLPHYLHNKLRVRREWGERVYAQLPASLPAQRELVASLAGHLRRDHREYFCAAGDVLRWSRANNALSWPGAAAAISGGEPLWHASQWVADDLCILLPGRHGYELAAASLCAPSYWRLEEKIGRPLDQIHRLVPGFQQKLSPQLARFFDHLLPEYPVWRGNWSVVNSPDLLQRGGNTAQCTEPGALFLRVERQSLRRLPETGAVVFTIRVMINPLADLLAVAGAVAALRVAVQGMSPQESRYKSLAPLRPALDAFFLSCEHV